MGRAAEQARLGVEGLEVAADRDRFGDAGAVVELEDRECSIRVLLAERVGSVLFVEGHALVRHIEPLLGKEDPHASRARRFAALVYVDLHSGLLRLTRCVVFDLGERVVEVVKQGLPLLVVR